MAGGFPPELGYMALHVVLASQADYGDYTMGFVVLGVGMVVAALTTAVLLWKGGKVLGWGRARDEWTEGERNRLKKRVSKRVTGKEMRR